MRVNIQVCFRRNKSPTSCLFWQHRFRLSGCLWLSWSSTSDYNRGSSPPSIPPTYAGPATAAAQSNQDGRPLVQTHPYSDQAKKRVMNELFFSPITKLCLLVISIGLNAFCDYNRYSCLRTKVKNKVFNSFMVNHGKISGPKYYLFTFNSPAEG